MREQKLESAPSEAWRRLIARDGPWRTPVLASAIPGGGANARIVVLRFADAATRELVFFTDRRSAKMDELQADGEACFVIYDADAGVQLRLFGRARGVDDAALLDAWWHGLGEQQQRLYAAGTTGEAARRDTDTGRGNFTAFRVTIDRFHCLWLHNNGNRAAEFAWRGEWEGRWVRP